MTRLSKATLATDLGTAFPDNTAGDITPADLRTYFTDLLDSLSHIADVLVDPTFSSSKTIAGTAPAYQFLIPTADSLTATFQASAEVDDNHYVIANRSTTRSFVVRDSSNTPIVTLLPEQAIEFIFDGTTNGWFTIPHGAGGDATYIRGRIVQNVAPTDGQIFQWSTANNRWEVRNATHFHGVRGLAAGATYTFNDDGGGVQPNPIDIDTLNGQLVTVSGTGATTFTYEVARDPFSMRIFNQSDSDITLQAAGAVDIFGTLEVQQGEMIEVHSHSGAEEYATKPIVTIDVWTAALHGSVENGDIDIILSAPAEGRILASTVKSVSGTGTARPTASGVPFGSTQAINSTGSSQALSEVVAQGERFGYTITNASSLVGVTLQFTWIPGF